MTDRLWQLCSGALALAMMGTAVLAGSGEPPTYNVRFITPGLSAINAAAMNEAGDVVGTGTTGSGAWISRGGQPAVLLPLPPGAQFSFANDINDAGVIVGAVSSLGVGKAVAWIPDGTGGYIIEQLGTLPGHISSSATAVNNVGDIIGSSHNGTFSYPVLFTASSGIQDLSVTGIFDPVDINDQRVLVDHSFTCKTLDLNTMQVQDLGVPAGPPNYIGSRGEAINDAGQVAGSVLLATSTSCDRQAARFTDRVGWEVFSACGSDNSARDINDHGDVVMQLSGPFGVGAHVRFEGNGTFEIETLIDPAEGPWFVINGFGLAINNARQLAVPAHNTTTGEGGIVLLTPIGPSADLDGDGLVNGADLGLLLTAWGPCDGCAADLNGDGVVDGADLGMLLAAWTT